MTTSLHQPSLQRTGKDCSLYVSHNLLYHACSQDIQLRSTKQLLGRAGDRFLLFGMLVHSKEGKLCLEDDDGTVELDFSQLVSIYTLYLVFTAHIGC